MNKIDRDLFPELIILFNQLKGSDPNSKLYLAILDKLDEIIDWINQQ